MWVFLSEYITSGALAGEPLPASLLREGLAMRNALAADMLAIPGVSVAMTCDHRVPGVDGAEMRPVESAAEERRLFEELCRAADAVLVIAPESDGVLLARCLEASQLTARLLNCEPGCILSCGDKLALCRQLEREGIPTIPTQSLWNASGAPVDLQSLPEFPVVIKPRHGAGSQRTYLCHTVEDVLQRLPEFTGSGAYAEPIVQPFIPGRALSIAAVFEELTGRRKQTWPVAAQHLSDDGCFTYLGGEVPIDDCDRKALTTLVRKASRVLGFTGYVGFDLLVPDADPQRPVLVEINPRLTTSYVGYRQLAASNLAAVLLGMDQQEPRWRGLRIRYTAAGDITES